MIKSKAHFFNNLFIESGRLSHHRFNSNSSRLESAQNEKLSQYLNVNENTLYGKKYDFKNINDYKTFSEKVPIIEDWSQLHEEITSLENGTKNVLTHDAVLTFEETSGTSGQSKLVPYTRTLKREFQEAVQVWMYSLNKNHPETFYGKAYWSISPPLKDKRISAGGLKIGLDNDSDYFDPITALVLSQIMAVDSSVSKSKDSDTFYFQTLFSLLLEKNLSFVSCWSPGFFIQLDSFLRAQSQALLDSIKKTNLKRHSELIPVLKGDFTWKDIWPGLSCISCWGDAQSVLWLPRLKQACGRVYFQAKGLLSTEAVISIPFNNLPYPVLAYRSHFFEFRNIETKQILLAHELEEGKSYEVIVTTAGGLYRYCTHDLVEVKGFYKQLPLLKFMGRSNRTSDLVGEKLSEAQLTEIIEPILQEELNAFDLIFLRPLVVKDSAAYVLYIETGSEVLISKLENIVRKVESGLCLNPYYKQALAIRQLKPLQFKLLTKGFSSELRAHYRDKNKIREGNIKLPLLFLKDELAGLNLPQ